MKIHKNTSNVSVFHYSKSGSLEKRSQINFLIKVSKYLDIIPGNNLSVLVQVYTARLCKEGFTNYKFSVFLLALKLLPSIWHTSLKIEKMENRHCVEFFFFISTPKSALDHIEPLRGSPLKIFEYINWF